MLHSIAKYTCRQTRSLSDILIDKHIGVKCKTIVTNEALSLYGDQTLWFVARKVIIC